MSFLRFTKEREKKEAFSHRENEVNVFSVKVPLNFFQKLLPTEAI